METRTNTDTVNTETTATTDNATVAETQPENAELLQQSTQTAEYLNRLAFRAELVNNLTEIMPIALTLFAVGLLFSYWHWRVVTYVTSSVGFFLFALYGGAYQPLLHAALIGVAICMGGIVWEVYKLTQKGFKKPVEPVKDNETEV